MQNICIYDDDADDADDEDEGRKTMFNSSLIRCSLFKPIYLLLSQLMI